MHKNNQYLIEASAARGKRRGVLLGLTLAELMLLLAFVIFFLWFHQYQKAHEARLALDSALKLNVALTAQNTNLSAKLDVLAQLTAGVSSPAKFAAELVELRKKADTLSVVQGELDTAKKALSEQVQRAEALKSVVGTLHDTGNVIEKLAAAELENRRLTGQLASIQRLLDRAGKGLEMPSCWATTDGRPEYIYDVVLGSAGISMTETDLPNRAGDRAALPTAQIALGVPLADRDFLQSTRALYDWSNEKQCRFYVRISDSTGPAEKTLYKSRLQVVEGRFYKFLISK